MTFPIIEYCGDIHQFIDCWSNFYSYDNDVYYSNIQNKPLSEDNIRKLFEWKNGMRLSGPKARSVELKIISKIDLIHKLIDQREDVTLQMIDQYFENVSAIWRIFLAHIIDRTKFPIFDQHVYRAMMHLQNRTIEELPDNDNRKLMIYNSLYLPFYFKVIAEIDNQKKFDEAMWAYGRTLSFARE